MTVINVTVSISEETFTYLWSNATSYDGEMDLLMDEKEERFRLVEGEPPGEDWLDGMVMWCDTGLEALTLMAYEKARGYRASLLTDENVMDSPFVVLSSRSYQEWGLNR
jgi:hypothetical protein